MRRNICKALVFFSFLPLLAGCGSSFERLVAQGNKAFARQDWATAADFYAQAHEQAAERPEPVYNLGNTHYRQQAFPQARDSLSQALQTADGELSQFANFNLGNAYYQMGDWQAAIEAYKEALRQNPDDLDAKYNLELALRHLEEDNQSEEPPPEEDQPTPQPTPSPEGTAQSGTATATPSPTGERDTPQTGDSQAQPPSPEQQGPQPQSTLPDSPPQGMTEAQARQLLEAVAENSESLQAQLGRTFLAPGAPPEKDW